MRGGHASSPRRCGRRGRRVFVIGTISGAFVLREIFNVYTLSFEFGFEQSQLFFSDLLAAASTSGGE